MEEPAFLPQQLYKYLQVETDAELFVLLQNGDDLLYFFEYAVEDETWSDQHGVFFTSFFTWVSVQFFQERLPQKATEKIVTAFYQHYSILYSFLPLDITIRVEKQDFLANRLLYGVSSDFLHALVHPVEAVSSEENLPQENSFTAKTPINLATPAWSFPHLHAFIMTGTAATLWKERQEQLFLILKEAQRLGVYQFALFCEKILKRYIDSSNAATLLKAAHKESWFLLKQTCCQQIDEAAKGVKLEHTEIEAAALQWLDTPPFVFEFIYFSDTSLDLFFFFQELITHLICGGNLVQEPPFEEVVQKLPLLISLNISHSKSFSEYLAKVSKDLAELDVSSCIWLTPQNLRKITALFPALKRLKIESNVQLGSLAWGELYKLPQLRALSLSRCQQIHDDDFMVLLKACRTLSELEIAECIRLTDRAFLEMAKMLPTLTILDLSRCQITDGSLIEVVSRCLQLHTLILEKCRGLTEKGILQVVHQAHLLRKLDLSQCWIAEETLHAMKRNRPQLQIIH